MRKDAILSLIMPLVKQWVLKAFPCRGFASLSSTYAAAKTFKMPSSTESTLSFYT